MEAILNHDFKDQLSNVKVLTLIVSGSQDFFAPVGLLRDTANNIPGAKPILYDKLGHDAAFSKQLASDVLIFLKEGKNEKS